MSLVEHYDYLLSIEADTSALVDIAADSDLALPVPACPGWTLKDLVEHVSGANRWVSHCVSSGLAPDETLTVSGDDTVIQWWKGLSI